MLGKMREDHPIKSRGGCRLGGVALIRARFEFRQVGPVFLVVLGMDALQRHVAARFLDLCAALLHCRGHVAGITGRPGDVGRGFR